MKKKIIKIVIVVLIIGVIFLGKKIIDDRTIDYSKDINKYLTSYYVNGNASYLDEIVKILDKNKDNEKAREKIQSLSSTIVQDWFIYLDGKYLCDTNNLNACEMQLNEFNTLTDKLEILYTLKSNDGYTIIKPSMYSSLKRQGDKKISDLTAVVNNPGSINPNTSEDIRIRRCVTATDCQCRDNVCQCYYTIDGVRESVTCKNNVPNE